MAEGRPKKTTKDESKEKTKIKEKTASNDKVNQAKGEKRCRTS